MSVYSRVICIGADYLSKFKHAKNGGNANMNPNLCILQLTIVFILTIDRKYTYDRSKLTIDLRSYLS